MTEAVLFLFTSSICILHGGWSLVEKVKRLHSRDSGRLEYWRLFIHEPHPYLKGNFPVFKPQ
jgi:hypothetical protein